MRQIPFTEIPRTTRLFADFLYDRDKVSRFYGQCGASLIERARLIGSQEFDRERVADALERMNRRFGSPDLTFENIEKLRQGGSVAVVTGQQAGLFTGPLYTILKALSAIKLAHQLSELGAQAVPVFWVSSEDHDYQEVNHCRVVDREGHVREIRYEACGRRQDAPIGKVQLCEHIQEKIAELASYLPASEFMPELLEDLQSSYAAGAGFAEAFAKLLARIFSDYGVVLLDPLDDLLKRVAAPIYAKAVERSEQIARALLERSAELERAGYHAQVHVSEEMVPLFIMEDGRRAKLIRSQDRFFAKGSDRSFDREELARLALDCPNCFSPNVTLRPAVQDYLVPTVAYIGGPAEIAYFAQLQVVYEELGRIEPCVLPRASMTIVEGRHQRTLERYGLSLTDFFEGLHAAVAKVVERSLDADTAKIFAETEQLLSAQLDKLEAALRRTDATLADALKRARSKVFYQIEHLRTRFVHASAHRQEAIYRQVERACTALYPNRNLQERELNIYYFLSRYGKGFIRELYDAVELNSPDHKLFYVSAQS
jgi:bacillithiol biosynthesis cysteine-adding enzyme BshC